MRKDAPPWQGFCLSMPRSQSRKAGGKRRAEANRVQIPKAREEGIPAVKNEAGADPRGLKRGRAYGKIMSRAFRAAGAAAYRKRLWGRAIGAGFLACFRGVSSQARMDGRKGAAKGR